MQQSFHIAKIAPFYGIGKKELRQKKKVYSQDLGLWNYVINDFDPNLSRRDRVELLESYAFRFFADRYDIDLDIRYRRTRGKQEIDFIVKEKQAYEAKFSESSYRAKKYEFFKNNYPEIPLRFIHYDNVLEFNPGERT